MLDEPEQKSLILSILFVSIILTAQYVLYIIRYWHGWNAIPEVEEVSILEKDRASVAVIVAARNEAANIEACISSILQSTYRSFVLIVVDNNSTDNTWTLIKQFQDPRLHAIQNREGFKKESLLKAISSTNAPLLLFTDADCIVHEKWIENMVEPMLSKRADFVLGPLKISNYSRLIDRFQALDMMGMMGITAGGLQTKISYLANGGNLAFTREAFIALGGYQGLNHASGDDVMLVQKAAKAGSYKFVFVKSRKAIVATFALLDWKSLFRQRQRWASKALSYVQKKDRNVAIWVFLFILSICINILLMFFVHKYTGLIAVFQLLIKGIVDYRFLRKVNAFFEQKSLLHSFVPAFFIQFIMYIWSGFSSIFLKRYTWKGRKTT